MKRNRPTQATLAAFGIKKFVMHNGKKVKVDLPMRSEQDVKMYPCGHCDKSFMKPSGLATHTKCVHGHQSSELPSQTKNRVAFPPSFSNSLAQNDKHVETNKVEIDCKSVLRSLVGKVEGNIAKSEAAKKQAGKKRHSYTALFKAEAIWEVTEWKITQSEIAAKYGVDQAMLSRWISKKHDIFKEATEETRKLLKKGRKPRKYKQLYQKLFDKFIEARRRGQRVSFPWLWSKARKIQQDLDPNVTIKNHVIVRFLRQYNIRLRAKQRSKNRSKASIEPELKKWHTTYRERCIRSNSGSPSYDSKWGAFKPSERLNVDQSPLPFVVNVKKTYEYVEPGKSKLHNTWIAQPGSGLDKRQCSLQVMVRGEGKQPKLAIVFRGKGHVKPHERQAWHPKVDVYFQPNGWVDTPTCMQWTEKTLQNFIKDEKLDKFLLLCDNLEAQCSDEFKDRVHKLHGLVWYGLKNGTDLWQVVM